VAGLAEVARAHGLGLLFDAAHALDCSHGPRHVGGFGDAEIFSFHATKFINSFEGGAIATNNPQLAETVRCLRNFGWAGAERTIGAGTNAKMSEIAAAMGLTSLESKDEIIAVNRRNYEAYGHCLASIPGVRLKSFPADDRWNYQYVVLEIDEARAGISRDLLLQVLHKENLIAKHYFYPCHRLEPYRSRNPDEADHLPATERVAARVLQLPTGTAVGPKEIAVIADLVRAAVRHGLKLERLLAGRPQDPLAVPAGGVRRAG
jgi:dTDP-4-amino-4,6-dideoxygalactose transaminase